MSNQDQRSGDAWAYGPSRGRGRSRKPYAVIAPIVAFALVLAPAALAADLDSSVDLSSNVALPTEVGIGANDFKISFTATGNVASTQSGEFSVVTVYNMATDGTISAGATSQTVDLTPSGGAYNFSQCASQTPANALGCASNPIEINATLNVAAGTPNGTAGTLGISHTGSPGTTADASPASGHVIVVTSSYTITGFYAPVENRAEPGLPQIVNGVKGGSTVPLKFNIWDGDTAVTDTSAVKTMVQKTACNGGSEEDMLTVDELSSGNTSLRWDGDQFIYNWKTPKEKGTCYRVIVTAEGGATLQADFNLK